MDAVCEVCGAIGFERLLLCCSDCKGAHTHQYCLKEVLFDGSLEDWFCDECTQRNNESSHSSSLGKVSSERPPSDHAQFDSISQRLITRSWSGSSHHSSSVKAATKMSMSHPPAGIPAANEGGVRSSLPRDSYIVDFFDPIASKPRSEPAHERWDPMRSEGVVVVLKKSPGVGASVSADDWFDDLSCKPCSPPGPSLGLLGSLLGSDQALFDGGGLCRPRRSPSPSVQRLSNSPGGRSSSCLGLDEMDGSSKTVVLVVSQGVAPGMDSDSAAPRTDAQDVRASSEVSPSALGREFARRVTEPLQTSVLKAAPRRRSCRSPPLASLHRSGRLAAKSHLRAANATLQAQKVLSSKWDPATPKQQLAPQALNAFHHRSRLTRPRGKHCGCYSKWT
ncbi:hypothetical protein BDA96_08G050000 [Sorghum bicolor]|uniref:Zinc finger PHD-type domain-containing protein n=1 Tax=Sorghum bicolor TaxID=4558 RepID=A0A921U641_SORBI|nr:uncharacterized protein LOC8073478 [Sorghum bicolor]XP_021301534.1 uncharacterized protein LOC8073478 [Sorghum bicolor]XP_021301535.1 uncharacterized protein LOC8073478 [Sorghum bicolor]KAG0520167.1 hypothetical protein BDA96_08G050000 [Sorghum bicolor]|eukprot:XP_002442858.1 uncharacterized protein LOC8073478 [Sorghum bicolor]